VRGGERLAAIPGVELVNDSFFNEFTLKLPVEARPAVHAMAEKGVLGGVSLGRLYPGEAALANGLVVAVTETVTDEDIDAWKRRAEGGAAMTVNPSAGGPSARRERRRATVTGNRALMLEEPLAVRDRRPSETTGVDFDPDEGAAEARALGGLGALERSRPIGLAGLSEPETVRHYTRLSRQNYAIDLGLFPLGSCTMKHNPRLNEKVARLPGFADIHPLQPQDTVQGALELIDRARPSG
jgi:hypothetical protein